MHIHATNVNDAFYQVVRGVHTGTVPTARRPSRNGHTLTVEEPLTLTYERPDQRVLFNVSRDANPFFHLYESLWMLAGRNDVAPLAYYLPKMVEFSDDGKVFNGAYGYRWRTARFPEDYQGNAGEYQGIGKYAWHRQHGGVDQLDLLVNHLKAHPESRRAVLSMWNVEDDLLKVDQSRDVVCNLCITFQLRPTEWEEVDATPIAGPEQKVRTFITKSVLDMTVFNRSNDLIWGSLGANAVHFSFLQEYMAARLGVGVGQYHQVSSNAHVYSWNWKPKEWLAEYDKRTMFSPEQVGYNSLNPVPLVNDPEVFERELPLFVEKHKGYSMGGYYSEPFLMHVAQPLCLAFHRQKIKEYDGALLALKECRAEDWRIAATGWINRRLKKRQLAQEREKYHGGQHEGVE